MPDVVLVGEGDVVTVGEVYVADEAEEVGGGTTEFPDVG